MKSSFGVDNFLDSFETESDAINYCQHLSVMLIRGGYRFTKWLSSSRIVLLKIDAGERTRTILDLDFDALPTEKTI